MVKIDDERYLKSEHSKTALCFKIVKMFSLTMIGLLSHTFLKYWSCHEICETFTRFIEFLCVNEFCETFSGWTEILLSMN